MKRFSDFNVGFRLSVFINAAVVIILFSLGWYIYDLLKQKISQDTDVTMTTQVDDLVRTVQLQIAERKDRVEAALAVANHIFDSAGNLHIDETQRTEVIAVNQITREPEKIVIPSMYVGDQLVFNNVPLVDKITELTGCNSTIFQKTEQGYLRIATSVMQSDGSRATLTLIPNSSPVIEAIEEGAQYSGRAFVVNEWYVTAYRPIILGSRIIGALFTGMPEKDMDNIRKIFAGKRFLRTGYPFIVDKEGRLLVHPTKAGKTVEDQSLLNRIAGAGEASGKSEYVWDRKRKILYFKYLPEIESYVAVSLNKNEMLEMLDHLKYVLAFAILISLGVIILINHLLLKSLQRSLQEGVDFSRKIAEGDLTAVLKTSHDDEIGLLAKSLNQMVLRLREVVTTIENGAVEIAGASQQLSAGSQQLSQGASSQAAATEEVSSSMEEMTASIEQNTANAVQTEEISLQARQSMEKMKVSGKKSIHSINDIAGKISVINDIAFHTNILALNAAVEAAREGEHGRGFAVVAAEVQKLAERSKVAANEIARISKSSVTVTEESDRLISELTPEIERTAGLVQGIVTANREQNLGITQVNQALTDLNRIVQQNAAASEELACSAEELAGQAEQLKSMISFFKIREENQRL